MSRRKSKLSTFSTLHWFYSTIAFIFGIVPQSFSTKRFNRKISNNRRINKNIKTYRKRKCLQINTNQNTKITNEFNDVCKSLEAAELTTILNNNNSRNLDNLIHNHINVNRSSDNDQQRILCIRVENNEAAESIQDLLVKHASIFRDIRIFDLKELIQFIQSRTTTTTTTTNITYEDASTMTNIDHMCHQITSCASFITQNENVRRLKALEYIRIFLEMNKEEFFNYLINEEHLCQQKTLTIYQMIKLFLKTIYQSEHEQKQTSIAD
ncbi:unnamed protein product [Rotaria sp. Silwood1]|nr:unnamed protein product [Rotaria sp. Silwood1]CAF4524737.1 unnamed protein product [Rotaria sp. Silwood1]